MIVSNRNLDDVILFEECIHQSIDDSIIYMETIDKRKVKKYNKRKLSTPIFSNVVKTCVYNPKASVNVDHLTELKHDNQPAMSGESKTRRKKRFTRTQSLPNFNVHGKKSFNFFSLFQGEKFRIDF